MIQAGSGSAGRKALAYTNEEFGFGLPFAKNFEDTLEGFVDSEDLKLAQTFFMGRSSKKGPFMAVAEVDI